MIIKLILAIGLGVVVVLTSTANFLIFGILTLLITAGVLFSDKIIPPNLRYAVFIGFLGMGFGFWIAKAISDYTKSSSILSYINNSPLFFYVILGLSGFYFGYQGISKLNWNFLNEPKKLKKEGEPPLVKILDTSSIIDSRIIDICETGFIEGEIYVPKFVLNELQQVADSTDPVKRGRGRKGLSELNRLKQNISVSVKIFEKDYTDLKEVDHKLIRLAKEQNGFLITTDYNLNKLASLEGIKVLNVNELANALKPVVITNEELKITVLKEGKDLYQGIGYMDDGTMVVVDGGKEYIGKEINVMVTSVLQTAAGRMIFTQPKQNIHTKNGK